MTVKKDLADTRLLKMDIKLLTETVKTILIET